MGHDIAHLDERAEEAFEELRADGTTVSDAIWQALLDSVQLRREQLTQTVPARTASGPRAE